MDLEHRGTMSWVRSWRGDLELLYEGGCIGVGMNREGTQGLRTQVSGFF